MNFVFVIALILASYTALGAGVHCLFIGFTKGFTWKNMVEEYHQDPAGFVVGSALVGPILGLLGLCIFGIQKLIRRGKARLPATPTNTLLVAQMLDLDSIFRSIPAKLLKQMILNIAWYLLQEVNREFGSDVSVDLIDDPSRHVNYVMGDKELGLFLTFYINPLKVNELPAFLTRRWKEHTAEAYEAWLRSGER